MEDCTSDISEDELEYAKRVLMDMGVEEDEAEREVEDFYHL